MTGRTATVLAAASMACVLLAHGPVTGADFSTSSLRVGGKVDRRVVFDADSDGRKDIVLFRGRRIILFLQKKDRSFSTWPDQILRIWRNAVLCDLTRLKATDSAALVMASESSVACHHFKEGRFQKQVSPLIKCVTALGYPGENDVHCRKMFFDVDSDGFDDLVVPLTSAYAVFRQTAKGEFVRFASPVVKPMISLSVPQPGVLGSMRLTARFPVPQVEDFNGDGLGDFVLRNPEDLTVFLRKSGKGIPPRADAVVDTSLPDKDKKKTGRFSMNIETPVLARDLNGDGIMDVVKAQTMQGRTLVYLRGGGDTVLKSPHLVARVDGWPLGALSPDLNRDGLPDLVIGHVDKIGVWGALKIFLTGSVALHSAYFINRRGFQREPDRRMTITVPLRFATTAKGFRLGTTALINFDGDFNGDGLSDLLVKTGIMRLQVFMGDSDGVFARKPGLTLEIPDTENYMWVYPDVVDFNGDGISDIMLHYRDWEERMDRIVLLVSENKE
jgi:hypothetical protein